MNARLMFLCYLAFTCTALNAQATFFESYSLGGIANTIYTFQNSPTDQYTLLGMQIYGDSGQWEPCPAGFSFDNSGNQTNTYQTFMMESYNIISDNGTILQPRIDDLHFMMGDVMGDSLPPTIPYDLLFSKACRYDESRWLIAATHIGDWTLYLFCSDEEGHLSWTTIIPGNAMFPVSDMIRADANTFILSGFNNQIILVDNQGNYLESLTTITANGNPRLIKNTSSEEIIIMLRDASDIVHLYSYQNQSLSPLFQIEGFADRCLNVLADGDQIVYTGTIYGNPNSNSSIVKQERTGSLLWQYNIPVAFTINDESSILKTPDDCYLIAGIYHPTTSPYYRRFGILKIRSNGTPVSDLTIPSPQAEIFAYPNPFSDQIMLQVQSKTPESLDMSIYNIRGQLVKRLAANLSTKQSETISWDGKNELGQTVSPGVYFVKAAGANRTISKKIIYVK